MAQIDLSHFAKAITGKKVPAIACVDWVFNHLGIEPNDLKPDEPPSMGALVMLIWANSNKDEFFLNIWSKTIPSKAQIEMQEKLRDDGRVLTMLNNLDESFHADIAAKKTSGEEGR